MAVEDGLDLRNMRNLSQVLAATPSGTDAAVLFERLGLWTTEAHRETGIRPVFKRNLSRLEPAQLSDEYAAWTAEYGRVSELIGNLVGQRDLCRLTLKAAKARARSQVRRKYAEAEGGKLPTATAIGDEAEEYNEVIEAEQLVGLIELVLTQSTAVKEATTQYLATISREISFRDALLKARVYA